MEIDFWYKVPNTNGKYEVNETGEVVSTDYRHTGKRKPLKQFTDSDGYKLVNLYINGKIKQYRVNRLAYMSIKGSIPEGMHIDHLDGDKSNNNIANLSCKTPFDNFHNPITFKKHQKRVNKPVAQIDRTTGEIIKIFSSTREAERNTGVSHSSINSCCKGLFTHAGGFGWSYNIF